MKLMTYLQHCGMTSERQYSGARKDGRGYTAANKYVSLAKDTHATIQELLKAVFSTWFVQTV